MLEINNDIKIPEEELHFTFARSAGPGGQNVNKVNSKAILHWDVVQSPHLPEAVKARFVSRYRSRLTTLGEIVLSSQRYRDQGRNTEDCLEKLREMISAVLQAPTPRKKSKPSRGSKERRLQSKREQSQRKLSRRPPPRDDHD